MDGAAIVLMILAFASVLAMIQRAEKKKRRTVFIFLLPVIFIIVWYANARGYLGEAAVGAIIAAILNFLFWLLIGRYNPVGSSDNIKVLGLDD
jgi:K+-sensing histidine kinase KdpD